MSARSTDPAASLVHVTAALLALAVLVPPETDGRALAGCAALVALATLLAVWAGFVERAALVAVPLAVLAALRARFAEAPGEAVLPVAVFALAAAAGFAASAARPAGSLARTLRATLTLAGAWTGARAVYEVVYGFPALAQKIRTDASLIPDAERILGRLEQGRAYAGFPTPAAAGGLLAIALPITVSCALARTGRARLLFAAAAVLQAAGLLATRSITAAAALLVAVALAGALARSRRLALAGAAVAGVIVLFAVLRSGQVLSRATDDSPAALRARDVGIAIAIARDHPWLGVGPGGYGEAYPRYRSRGADESRHAHMTPAEWIAEWGGVSGIVLAGGFFAIFLGPLLARRDGLEAVSRGEAIGLAAFALQGLADFTVLLPSLLLVATLLRATLVLPRPETPRLRVPRLGLLALGLTAAAVVLRAGTGDAALDAARESALVGDRATALAQAERAWRWAPWSADAALFVAQAARSPEAAERALALVPTRAAAHAVRAQLRAATGDLPGAWADLRRARVLNPTRKEYEDMLAQVQGMLPQRPRTGQAR